MPPPYTISDPRPPSEQITTGSMFDDFEVDIFTRWVIAIVSFLVAIPIFAIGLALWVAYINNFNILGWLE